MLFSFPDLNKWSSPLLFLTLQGLLFVILLFVRWYQKRKISDLLLGLLLLILCYHRTTYTIGFMDWYDTFRNTKINYYLIAFSLSTGPLLYLYVKSVTTSGFRFRNVYLWHFLPQALYVIYKLSILVYDSMQPGFNEIQNGVLMESFENQIFNPFYVTFAKLQLILYLAFTIQLFYLYRQKIYQYYSNIYQLEMNWLRNFLAIYVVLYVYEVAEILVGMTVLEMSWTHRWWSHFIAALAIIYIGVKGYFTDTSRLKDIEFNIIIPRNTEIENSRNQKDYKEGMHHIMSLIENEKIFLDPDLSLKSMAQKLNINQGQLSEIINNGFQKNFNDFINEYRISEVKSQLLNGRHKELSLVGIALNCGFNSKATFNRVFKKVVGQSPTEFLKSIV